LSYAAESLVDPAVPTRPENASSIFYAMNLVHHFQSGSYTRTQILNKLNVIKYILPRRLNDNVPLYGMAFSGEKCGQDDE
jgi:hypothetical protein